MSRRTLRQLSALTVVTAMAIGSAAFALLGDLDGNGAVTGDDARQVLESVVGTRALTPSQRIDADVDGDGQVTSRDALLIQQRAFGLISEFPRRLPQGSGPIAVSRDDSLVAVVNPDSDSITLIETAGDGVLAEIPVGREPAGVAFTRDGARVLVTNSRDASVSIVDTASRSVAGSIPVGVEPFGIVVNFRGDRAYVANMASGTISEIDVATAEELRQIPVGFAPQGLAVTRESDQILVTHLRGGEVSVVDASTFAVTSIPLTETPFDAMNLLQPAGVPNRMKGIAIHPTLDRAWLPHILSNSGNFVETLFNTSIFPAITVVDTEAGVELPTQRMTLFSGFATVVSSPEAVAFAPEGGLAYVVSAASNDLTIFDTTTRQEVGLVRDVGDHPRGIAVTADGAKAYVFNRLTPSVSVVDLAAETLVDAIPVSQDPLPANVANGRRLFFTSALPEVAQDRFFGCEVCHFDGRDDGQTWFFTNGPRQTLTLAGGTLDTGLLHHNADRATVQDFAATFTRLQNGTGLTQDQLDDLADFVNSGIRFLENPFLGSDLSRSPEARRGRRVFDAAGCAGCHAGPFLTDASGHTDLSAPLLHNVGVLAAGSGSQDEFDKTRDQAGIAGGVVRPPGFFESTFLLGVWSTPPFLHDARSATLREVVDQDNPTDQHGVTSMLSPQELDDLVAYMRELDITNARVQIEFPADAARVVALTEVSGAVRPEVSSVDVILAGDAAHPIAATVEDGRFVASIPPGAVPAGALGDRFDVTALAETSAGEAGRDDVELEINYGASPVPGASVVDAAPTLIAAGGGGVSVVTIEPRDGSGERVGTGLVIQVSTNLGELGPVEDLGDGRYRALLTSSPSAGTAIVTARRQGGATFADTAEVVFAAGDVDALRSSATASPVSLEASGLATADVTVIPRDSFGNELGAGQGVSALTDRGTIGAFVDRGDGSYAATYTAPTATGTAHITVTVNGVVLSNHPTLSLVPDVTSPATPDLGRITVAAPVGGVSQVIGGAGAVEPLSTVTIRNLTSGAPPVSIVAGPNGAFSLSIAVGPNQTLSIDTADIAANAGPAAQLLPFPEDPPPAIRGIVQTADNGGGFTPIAGALVELTTIDLSVPCSPNFLTVGTLLSSVSEFDGQFEIELPTGFDLDLDLDPDLLALAVISGPDTNLDGSVDDIERFALVDQVEGVIVDEISSEMHFLNCDNVCGLPVPPPANNFSTEERVSVDASIRAATIELDFFGLGFGGTSFAIEDDVFFDVDGPKDALDQIASDTYCAAAESVGTGTLPSVIHGRVVVPSANGPVAIPVVPVELGTVAINPLTVTLIGGRSDDTDANGDYQLALGGAPPYGAVVIGSLSYNAAGLPGAFNPSGSVFSLGRLITDPSEPQDVDLAGRAVMNLVGIPGVPIANFNAGEIEELTDLCRSKIAAQIGTGIPLASRTLAQVFSSAAGVCATDLEVQALLAEIDDPEGNSCNVSVTPGSFEADGVSQLTVTIEPIGAGAAPLGPGRLLELETTLGVITSPPIDERDGTYTARLRAPIIPGTAHLSILLEGAVCPQVPSPIHVVFAEDDTNPAGPVPSRIFFTSVGGGVVTVVGLPGAVEPNSMVIVVNGTTLRSVSVLASADGSFRADVAGVIGQQLLIHSVDAALNSGAVTPLTVSGGLAIPGIANPSSVPAGVIPALTSFGATGLGAPTPSGYAFLAGFDLDLDGETASVPLDVVVQSQTSVPTGSAILLVQEIEVLGEMRLRVVGSARSAGGLLFPTPGPNFPGVREGGSYAYLATSDPVAFAFGSVSGARGAIEGAFMALDTADFVDLTRADGTYLLAGPIGTTVVSAAAFEHGAATNAPAVLLPFAEAEVPTDFTLATRADRSFAFTGRFGDVSQISEQLEIEPAGDRLWVPAALGAPRVQLLATDTLAIDSSFDDTQRIGSVAFTPNGFEAFIGYFSRARDFTLGIEEPGLLISTVGFPRAVAVTPDGDLALIASSLDNSSADTNLDALFVIDTFTNKIDLLAPAIGADPTAIAVSPDGTRAYVSSATQHTVTVVDLPGRVGLATVPVGDAPSDVAISHDGSQIYVANLGSDSVSVLDAAAAADGVPGNETIAMIGVGAAPRALSVTPDGARLLVAEQQDDTVSVIDLATLEVEEVWATVDLPTALSIHPDGTRAYVLDRQTRRGVLEVPLAESDTTPPRVVDSGPRDRSATLLQDSPIEIVFSEKMDAATLIGANIQLFGAGGSPLAGTLGVEGNGVTALFTPAAGVRYALNTNVRVSLGTGLRDVAGNSFAAVEERLVPTLAMQLPSPALLSMDLTTGGVLAGGAPGAVEPKSLVVVSNLTTGESFSTVAAADGSFGVAVEGLDTHSYQLVTSTFGGRAVTDPVPLVANFSIQFPNPSLISYQPGAAGTLAAVGAPGAVDPQSTRLLIRNVTSGRTFQTTTIAPDGSFSLGIFASPGESLEIVSTILGAIVLDPVALASPSFAGPALDFVTPDRFPFGDAVTLTIVGTGFGSVPANILLEVGGQPRTDFTLDTVDGSATQQAILVGLATGADSGQVRVSVAGQTSNALSYSAEIPTNTSPFAEEVVSSFTAGDPNAALGQSDANYVDLGEGGEIVLRLGSTVRDGAGMDLQLFEDTTDGADCYQVLVSASSTGPFDSMGQFCGNAFVNLNGHDPIRFVKLVDASDSGNAATMGSVFAIRVELSIDLLIDGEPVGSSGGGEIGVSVASVSIDPPAGDKTMCVSSTATFTVKVSPQPQGGGGYGGGCTDTVSWSATGPAAGSFSPASQNCPGTCSSTFQAGNRDGQYHLTATVSRTGSGCSDVSTSSKSTTVDVKASCFNAHTLTDTVYECLHFVGDANGTPCSTTEVIQNVLNTATCDSDASSTCAASCNVGTGTGPEVVQTVFGAACGAQTVNWHDWHQLRSGCGASCTPNLYQVACVTGSVSGPITRGPFNRGSRKVVGSCP